MSYNFRNVLTCINNLTSFNNAMNFSSILSI